MGTKIIAEYAGSHLGDRRLIEEGIKVLALLGIDYIKFQSFKANNLNKNWPDYEKSLEYYKTIELSYYDHVFIIEKCKQYGIKPLFSVFDRESANMVYNLGLTEVKIASPDADKWEFVNYCANKFKTLYISCGMISRENLVLLKYWYNNHKLFYCISKYPTSDIDIDFDKMALYDGFSSHCLGIKNEKKAIDLGMGYIEKHFTLGKYLPGKDHIISSMPDEFKDLVEHRNYVDKCKIFKTRWSQEGDK